MSVFHKLTLVTVLVSTSICGNAISQATINPSALKALPKVSAVSAAALKRTCANIDLGISSVRIDRLEGGLFSATYEIRNFGRDAWESAQGQAGSIITLASSSARNPNVLDTLLPSNAAPGAIVHSVTSNRNHVDYARRGSRQQVKYTLDILISFDPDIRNDSNTCNDDADAQNNTFYLGSKLDDFLYQSREQSKIFTFADRQAPLPLAQRTEAR